MPLSDGGSLDTYLVLESDGQPISDAAHGSRDRSRLLKALAERQRPGAAVTRRAPRQVRMFTTPIQVAISRGPKNRRTLIELVAGDRPGPAVRDRRRSSGTRSVALQAPRS